MNGNLYSHTPVMLKEVLEYLDVKDNEIIVDATFGAGGYTKAILNKANCKVIGIDRDSTVEPFAINIKNEYKDRFSFFNEKYSNIQSIVKCVDGIVLDLGISSMQVDNPERGFSFNKDSILDMRMGKNDISAYDIINNYSEENLANIIFYYGDEVKARVIAKKIIEIRKKKKIQTTLELANIVRSAYSNNKNNNKKIDCATKTFQAIRIAVNNELIELQNILEISKNILNKNGRLVVVSFHSLEDKIVKNFIKKNTEQTVKNDKYSTKKDDSIFQVLTKKAIKPTQEEINNNIRARSAKLRAVKKC